MKCVFCNNNFYIKRSILELFKIEKEYICNRCYKEYPINIRLEKIHLDIYECTIISMFDIKIVGDYLMAQRGDTCVIYNLKIY